jgi:hypothetical protein
MSCRYAMRNELLRWASFLRCWWRSSCSGLCRKEIGNRLMSASRALRAYGGASPVLALLFFVFYLIAGIAIHPWIAAFYQNRPLPSLGQLFLLQFFRGLFRHFVPIPTFTTMDRLAATCGMDVSLRFYSSMRLGTFAATEPLYAWPHPIGSRR